MKRLLLVLICLVLFSGCIEQKDDREKVADNGPGTGLDEQITVTISSPRPGEVLKGDNDVSFEGAAKGGKGPYSFSWSSNRDGVLSTESSFTQNQSKLGKGQHTITLAATDANGRSGKGSVIIYSM